jgi:mRNA-degrading endonuclease RelE of RelBE toxin-antitoxin system
MPEQVDTTNIKFKYSTLYWGAGITIIITTIFILVANYSGIEFEIRDIVAIMTCGIVSTTLVYHAKNLRLNFEVNKEKIQFDILKYEEEKKSKQSEKEKEKIAHAFHVSSLWFKPDMANHVELSRKFLREHKDKLQNHKPISEFISELESNIEARKAVICVLNYFENISLLIKNDLVDENCIKQCFKTLFIDYLKLLRNYIDEIQKESDRFLMNYEEIAKKWGVS